MGLGALVAFSSVRGVTPYILRIPLSQTFPDKSTPTEAIECMQVMSLCLSLFGPTDLVSPGSFSSYTSILGDI